MSTLLRVEGIEVGYGDLIAVREVTFEVRPREAVALVGSNGAGKTTTLRAISGLLPLRRGGIVLDNQRLDGIGPSRVVGRGVAHVPEGRQLFPTMTVRENLELGASATAAGRTGAGRTLDWVFDLFPRLRERAGQLAGTLSGGEQQMCAIGLCPRERSRCPGRPLRRTPRRSARQAGVPRTLIGDRRRLRQAPGKICVHVRADRTTMLNLMSRWASGLYRGRRRSARWPDRISSAPGRPLRWVVRYLTARSVLIGLGMVIAAAALVAAVVLYVSLSGLEAERIAALDERQSSVAGAIEAAERQLSSEAESLARDPAVISVVFPGPTGVSTDGSPPAFAMLTEGIAELLVVLDAQGAPVIRAPPRAFSSARLPEPLRRGGAVGIIDEQAYLLGVALVPPPDRERTSSRAAATVLVGRRLHELSGPLITGSPRGDIAVLDGDELIWSTLPGLPPRGWRELTRGPAAEAHSLLFQGRDYGLHSLTRIDTRGVWALVPRVGSGASTRAALPWWLAGALTSVAALAGVGAWIGWRRRPPRHSVAGTVGVSPGGAGARGGRNRELEVLNAIAVSIGRSTDLQAIAVETLAMLRSLARVDMGAVYRLDGERDRLVLVAQQGLSPEHEEMIRIRPVAGTSIGATVRTGRLTLMQIRAGAMTDPSVRAVATAREHRTQVALPITASGEPWGVMALVAREDREFSGDEIRLLETVAHQVGVAVERTVLYTTATARLRRLEAMREIETHISQRLDLARVLEVVVNSTLRLIGGTGAIVLLRDGNVLYPRAWQGMGDWFRETAVPVGVGVLGRAVEGQRGILVNDDRASGIASVRLEEVYPRVVAQPLMAGEQVVGVLAVNREAAAAEFTPDDLATLADFATPAAIAIANARLFEQSQGYARRLRALQDVNLAMSASLDLASILGTLTQTAAEFFRAELATVWVAEDGARWLVRRSVSGDRALSADLVDRLAWGRGAIGWIAIHQMPVMAAHVAADEAAEYRDWALRHELNAFTGLPLAVGGRLLGVLTLNRIRAEPLSSEEVAMLDAMAAQAAIAIENARLLVEARQRAAEYRALFEVGSLISATLDADRVLELIVERCREVMDVRAAAVFQADTEPQVLWHARGIGLSAAFVSRIRFGPGEETAGRALRDRTPSWSADLLDDPAVKLGDEARSLVAAEGYRASLSVPVMIQGDDPYGVLAVYWWQPHAPSASEIQILTGFAGQAGIALHNARLYRAATDRGQRLSAVSQLTESLTATLGLDETLSRVTGSAVELFGSLAQLWLLDEDGEHLTQSAVAGTRLTPPGVHRLRIGEGLIGGIAAARESLVISDLRRDPRLQGRDWGAAEGTTSFAGVPLLLGDRLLGVLSVAMREERRFGAEDVRVLQSLANHAAIAIEDARLYALEQSRRTQIEALAEIARELASELDPDRLLPLVVERAGQFFRGDGTIFLREPDGNLAPAARGGPLLLDRVIPIGEGVTGRCAALRAGVLVNDYSAAAGGMPEIVRSGVSRVMAQPLVAGDRLLGVISMYRRGQDAATFSRDDLEALERFAIQAAVALENARLYREAREYANRLLALEEVNRVVSSSLQVTEVLRNVAAAAARFFEAPYVSVWVMNPAGDRLRRAVEQGDTVIGRALSDELAVGEGAAGWVAAHGQSILWADVLEDTRTAQPEALLDHGLRFFSCYPIVLGDRVLGVLTLHRSTPLPATPETASLLASLAAQAAVAMDHARLFAEVQDRLRETGALLALSRTLSSTFDAEALPRLVLQHVAEATGCDSVGLWTLDESGAFLVPSTGYHLPPGVAHAMGAMRMSLADDVFYAEAARTRRPVATSAAAADPRMPARLNEAVPHRSQLFAPIVTGARVVAGISAVWWERARELSVQELALVEAIASQAGVALTNARLFTDNRRRVEELSALHELSRAVTGQLDEAGVLEAVVQQIGRVLDARHLEILLTGEGASGIAVAVRIEDGRRRMGGAVARVAPEAVGLGRIVLELRRTVRTDDYLQECARYEVAPDAADLSYWMGVPMIAGERALGAVVLRGRARPFSEAEERLLTNLTDLAALALRSAQLFAERTKAYADLAAAQDQLVRSEKLQALGEMASGVAHDFNNVLAAIVGRAQLLLRYIEDPKFRRWIEIIERSALDGAHTVRQLQEFTRIRRNQPFGAVDLNQVVHDALDDTEARWGAEARRRGLQVRVETALDPRRPHVLGDAAELREALVNMILNALDAMPGGGDVTLRTLEVGDRVELAVSDTGIGIPADLRGKIFDPFFTTKGPKGTGLGLSMTYGILTRHEARVTVESEEGRGTTFLMSFSRTAARPDSAPAPPALPAAAGHALRCLVVDDEARVGEMLGDLLVAAGHRAVVCSDGSQAVARFGREPFDVVFTDLAMPGFSGWQVARAVKNRAPEVPVFLVTGFGAEVSSDELRANGVDAVLAKPLQITDLLGALAGRGPRPGEASVGPVGLEPVEPL
ncbi:MAG TPA: GAF domain-containing protein [Candidatus Binatia bacterium]|nr:GAF domain-containing protein [Candidatus Binatia bacterium]